MGVKELSSSQIELFDACRRGDLEKVKSYITSKKSKKPRTPLNFLRPATPSLGFLISIKDPTTLYTPLHTAALHGHDQICRLLIGTHTQITSAKDKRGCIPLHLAAWNGHLTVVKILTNADPESIDIVNNAQESSLHLSAQHGHSKIVRVLLEKHADPRLRNARFETPLDIAARAGHAVVCKLLVGLCPELALLSAVECSSTAENGHIRPQVVYPLHAAAKHSHIPCLQILRLSGFDIDFVTDEGSALHVAAMFGQVEAVRYLVQEGINPSIRDSQGRTVLEMLEEHETQRASDLTQIIQSRESWSECRKIIEAYIHKMDSNQFNSSSDSGIDKRDCVNSENDDEKNRDIIWRPLPTNTPANLSFEYNGQRSNGSITGIYHPPSIQAEMVTISNELEEANSALSQNTAMEYDLAQHRTSVASTSSSQSYVTSLNRTWNSRMYDAERGVPRFPITSPLNKSRHQSSKRTGETLPPRALRTHAIPQRASILPMDSTCVYRAPPLYDAWQQKIIGENGITHTYNPAFPYDNVPKNALVYDNSPPPGHKRWDHSCSRLKSRGAENQFITPCHENRTHTLPIARAHTRPSLVNSGSPIKESSPNEKVSEQKIGDREDSLGLSQSPPLTSREGSRQSSVTFACSTLRRLNSPERFSTLNGRAPLAMPEELTGSTSTSIMSSSISPDRETRCSSMLPMISSISSATTSSTLQKSDTVTSRSGLISRMGPERCVTGTEESSFSSLSVESPEGPPSPNTSQSRIFNVLCSNTEFCEKLVSSTTNKGNGLLSPTVTDCSDNTVASSCSLPLVSQISTTPPSIGSPKVQIRENTEDSPYSPQQVKMRLGHGGQRLKQTQKAFPRQSLDEIDEWRKIDDILSSFGGAVCRESVFASDYEPQVAVFLRDRHSHALTLQLTSTPLNTRPNSVEKEVPVYESKYIGISQWLNTTVGIANPKAHEIGEILVKNGYDKITQLSGCLTASVLLGLGIDKSSQQQIICYLESVKDVRPNANNFNYVSDWLCSLELTDYLGNFVTAGFKSMLIVRTAELTEESLIKMSITLPGHISRILHSLKSARAEEVHQKMERAREMKRALSPEYAASTISDSIVTKDSTPYSGVDDDASENKDLLRGCTSFSAHYLGSMEISNIDGTEESRKAMTRLKKSIREIAKVPQVILEISTHGVRVLDGDTRCLTVEHEISRIQIVCQDERDLNCFTYISQDVDKNFCHVFCVLTADVATEIIVTLGQAFELAYKLQNRMPLEETADV